MPSLWPDNETVVEVYWMCKNQVRFGAYGNVVDIDFPAVKAAMEMLGVEKEQQRDVFLSVVDMFWYFEETKDRG